MRTLWREIKKHALIYALFARNYILEELQYRANILVVFLFEFGYVLARLMYVMVVHDTGLQIQGMPVSSIYLFGGTSLLMMTFSAGMLQGNVTLFGQKVREGDLDLLMVKPVSLQFIATLRHVDLISATPDALVGIPLVLYGWYRLQLPVDFIHIAGFLLFLLLGLILTYALLTVPMILAFYFGRIEPLHGIVWALWDFNNLPCRIQPRVIQWIGIYTIPIFLISNFSALFVMGRLTRTEFAWGCIAPFLFLGLIRMLWQRAVQQYASASS